LEAGSHVTATDAYVDVGDLGDGELHIADNRRSNDELNVGVSSTGDVAVDNGRPIDHGDGHRRRPAGL